MAKLVKVKKSEFTRAELEHLSKRLSMFIEINGYYPQTDMVMGNTAGIAAAKTLIDQMLKRGSIWEGGYLDNVGVVYTDQVAAHLAELKTPRKEVT
jgi:hypothetical protein